MGCNSSSQHAKAQASAGPQGPVLLGSNAGSGKDAPAESSPERQAAAERNQLLQATIDFIAQVPLFMRLSPDTYPILAGACTHAKFEAGRCIVTQGEEGKDFFIISLGEAEVVITSAEGQQQKVATLKRGDYFGENALLRSEPRSATIKAMQDVETLKISQDKFMELGLHEQIQFAQRARKRVGAGQAGELVVKEPSPKTPAERKLMEATLRNNEAINTMRKLDATCIRQIIDISWKEEVEAGKEIIKEGDLTADYFYICQSGKFEVYMTQKGKPKLMQTVASGGSFGELALLYQAPRAATVKAKETSSVWVIDRKNFKDILMKVSDERIKSYVKYLDMVEILSSLLAEEKLKMARALSEMHYGENEVIIKQGDVGMSFYILYEGEVSITVDGTQKTRLEASEERGLVQFFGERALLNNEPRAATVTVCSKSAKVLVLDRHAFNLLLGPLEDIIKNKDRQMKPVAPPAGGRQWASLSYKTKILKDDLQRVGLLGAGGFGAVELWEHKDTGITYAMKSISKGWLVKTGMRQSIIAEKNIMSMTKSDFIIKLHETYNSDQFIYFLMEPALGGELFSIYHKKGLYGSEEHARFYCGGVILAFEHLHTRHVIYRDLKPENLLLCEKGHLKLTDMGLAKFVIGRTYTTCGTPEYFAPEIIASTGHTCAVDWWTLGVLLFELLTGSAPFEAATPFQIYAKVKRGINTVKFPAKLSADSVDLIKAICQKEPADRLPMRANGMNALKQHAWYKDFDWQTFAMLGLEAPYVPQVKSKKDLRNFSVDPDDLPQFVKYTDDGSGWDKDFATSE